MLGTIAVNKLLLLLNHIENQANLPQNWQGQTSVTSTIMCHRVPTAVHEQALVLKANQAAPT